MMIDDMVRCALNLVCILLSSFETKIDNNVALL